MYNSFWQAWPSATKTCLNIGRGTMSFVNCGRSMRCQSLSSLTDDPYLALFLITVSKVYISTRINAVQKTQERFC